MILLNSEKELVKVESWDDILSRPGFTSNLNPAGHTLEAILGSYKFAEKIHCGLSNCHTLHAKGYIASTKKGRETNIGRDCGKKYFGVDFETMAAKFERDTEEKENRNKLHSFRFTLDKLKEKIAHIRSEEHGADWINKHTTKLVNLSKEMPVDVVRRINNMVKTQQNVLTTQRQATEQETENLEISQNKRLPRPHYIEEPIASIDGLECLQPENNLRTLLIFELSEKIRNFESLDIDLMNFNTLRLWSRWVTGIDEIFNRVNLSVQSGRKLLQKRNLSPFLEIIREGEPEPFEKFLKLLP